ncbi:hypothetical protein Metal_3692 [Methylomicrobium album BG8]|uniref:DUF2846 domain-containing protein n=2 Tax=Methylococcaceae TaxID=403 RepID=H8GHM1_METAL|nr:hypothetical protein Metal_3692 [Methylomicrobium album BG8]
MSGIASYFRRSITTPTRIRRNRFTGFRHLERAWIPIGFCELGAMNRALLYLSALGWRITFDIRPTRLSLLEKINNMKTLLLLISIFFGGCSTTIIIPAPSPLPSPDKATIVFIYKGLGIYETHKTKVFIDDKVVGTVNTISPLTVTVSPGEHKLYTKTSGQVIDRINSSYFQENRVYYMSIWFEGGVWAGSMWITEIPQISEFEVIKYSFQ